MELLQALGLDSTLLPQFLIFMVCYLAMTQLVFKPYLAIHEERKTATIGNQEVAERILLETQDIQYKFESRAREINSEIKNIFDAAKKGATKSQDELLKAARDEAEAVMKQTREDLKKAMASAELDVKKYVPELAQTISGRLLGKEIQ